jgi:hypothetical protein
MSMSVAGRRCWVVKGRAERNDFASVLRAGSCDRWFTKRPPRAWTRGDVVFVWESSPALRVVGVGLLVGFGTEGEDTVFLVRYVTDLLTNPVALSTIRAVPSLATASFTRAGAAGTVFPLDEAQAAQLAALVDDANRGLAAPMLGEFDDVTWPTRAISVRQPCGAYSWGRQDDRSTIPTNIRGTVAIYASRGRATPDEERDVRAKFGFDVDTLPRGLLVGTVEIVGCARLRAADARAAVVPLDAGCTDYGWRLEGACRAPRPMPPANHPQPVFFRPFVEEG